MSGLDTALSIALGIALAASVGFRVFVPLLVTSVAAHFGYVEVGAPFGWLATWPAITMLAVATAVEVLAYNVPAVDNLLDVIATPVALVAGTLLAAAVMTDLPPNLKWSVAVIAGGGAAGITQGVTSLLRAKSTAFTGGVANPGLALLELCGALLFSLLAVLLPFIALGFVVLLCVVALRYLARRRRARPG
jgi:hypothetical protein